MKLKSLFIAIVASYGAIYSQTNNFNLADYKLPEIDRQSLETNFGFSGNNNYLNSISSDRKNNNNSYNGNISLSFSSFLNTQKIQRTTTSNFSFAGSFNNSFSDSKLSSENHVINPSISFSIENRYYFISNKFIETDVNTSYSYKNTDNLTKTYSETTTTKDDKEETTHSFSVNTPLKAGIGRIEPVQDARQAVYIFDELKKQNRINKDITSEDILKLAKLVSKLNNERYFDYRLKKMRDIEVLDSFLVKNDYVVKSDARYFTTLSDMWLYGNTPVRLSGTRISAVVNPSYSINDDQEDKNQTTNKYRQTYYSFLGGVEFNYEKPISLLLQNSLTVSVLVGKSYSRYKYYDNNDNDNDVAQINGIYKLGFYPNTRTSIDWTNSVKYYYSFFNYCNSELSYTANNVYLNSSLNISYYISPKLSVAFNASIYYNWHDYTYGSYRNFNDSFSASLKYKLF